MIKIDELRILIATSVLRGDNAVARLFAEDLAVARDSQPTPQERQAAAQVTI